MSRDRFEAPRPEKKKKTIGEGAGDARHARISFKNYLRELEEQNEYEEDIYEDENSMLPDDEDGIEEIYYAFIEENDDLVDQARDIADDQADQNDHDFMGGLADHGDDDEDEDEDQGEDPTIKAVEFLMDELEKYLQNLGYSLSDVESWMEGPAGDTLFDMFYNGLT